VGERGEPVLKEDLEKKVPEFIQKKREKKKTKKVEPKLQTYVRV